ncbi:GlcG/HbpS family heme-binding protein [Bradyrhizobium guangdongense]|uniref:GlcG/HbpS family heme-binding protein n=1 Tax=Bradyrhizobium guangdongense TaxID=1325090 RepID=UPI001FDA717A|nr:heme-binding protein [Bradyrhizobium guangdongense]
MISTSMRLRVAVMFAGAVLTAQPAAAQVQKSGNFLSLELAMEAAAAAAQACEANDWPVSVSVVDAAGNVKLQAKGDHSTIHTKDSSFRKAYTLVTMGPLFDFDRLGVWVEKLKTNPYASTYATLPNMFLLPGAVAVRIKGEIVAAIGVGGAPGGEKDEACAAAGLAKIQSRLP